MKIKINTSCDTRATKKEQKNTNQNAQLANERERESSRLELYFNIFDKDYFAVNFALASFTIIILFCHVQCTANGANQSNISIFCCNNTKFACSFYTSHSTFFRFLFYSNAVFNGLRCCVICACISAMFFVLFFNSSRFSLPASHFHCFNYGLLQLAIAWIECCSFAWLVTFIRASHCPFRFSFAKCYRYRFGLLHCASSSLLLCVCVCVCFYCFVLFLFPAKSIMNSALDVLKEVWIFMHRLFKADPQLWWHRFERNETKRNKKRIRNKCERFFAVFNVIMKELWAQHTTTANKIHCAALCSTV